MKTQSRFGVTIDSRCKSIDLFITPTRSDASSDATLYISGIIDTDPEWDTWEWQIADKYDVGTTFNEEPTWTTIYTGGVVRANSDDSIIRVKLTIGTCTYYSNVSGYDDPYVAPYLVYTALISQSSTSNPTVTILQNTLGAPIVWTRIDTGVYNGTLASPFLAGKTYTSINNSTPLTPLPVPPLTTYNKWIGRIADNIIQIVTGDSGFSDNLLDFTEIEIRVYP